MRSPDKTKPNEEHDRRLVTTDALMITRVCVFLYVLLEEATIIDEPVLLRRDCIFSPREKKTKNKTKSDE